MRITVPILASFLATALFAATARADAPAGPAEPSPEPATVTTTFGGQILLADAAVVGLSLALGEHGGGAFLVGFPLASPIVHLAHGDRSGALGSFVLRLGAPVVGGMIGFYADAATCSQGEWFCGLGGLAIGALVGGLTASIVDAAVLAHVERPVPRRAQRTLPTPTVAVAPGGGFMVGLAGRL